MFNEVNNFLALPISEEYILCNRDVRQNPHVSGGRWGEDSDHELVSVTHFHAVALTLILSKTHLRGESSVRDR